MQEQMAHKIAVTIAEITDLKLSFVASYRGTVFTSYLYTDADGYCHSEIHRKNLEDNLRMRIRLGYESDNRIRVIGNRSVAYDEILVAVPNDKGEGISFLELMQEAEKKVPPQRGMTDKDLLPFWRKCAEKGETYFADVSDVLPMVCGVDYNGIPVVKSLSAQSGIQFVIGARWMGLTSYLNSVLLSLAYLRSPWIVKTVVIDPSATMPSLLNGIPHMALPIAQGIDDCIAALRWCCDEIERRNKFLVNEARIGKLLPGRMCNAIESGRKVLPFLAVFINDVNFLLWDKSYKVAQMLEKISGAWKEGVYTLVCANEITEKDVNGGGGAGLLDSYVWARMKVESAKRYNHLLEKLPVDNACGPGEVSDEYQTVSIPSGSDEQSRIERLIASLYSSSDKVVLGLFKNKKWKEALDAFNNGPQTDPELQYCVGECYDGGLGVKEDKSKAFEWHLKAAKGNHCEAQRTVGMSYLHGTGIEQNLDKGLFWLKKAADQEDCLALYFIGKEYFLGTTIPRDYLKAIEWLEKALTKRDPLRSVEIALMLGEIYMDNQSEAYNIQKARRAFELAEDVATNGMASGLFAEGGVDLYVGELKKLREALSNAKILEGLEKLKALAASCCSKDS